MNIIEIWHKDIQDMRSHVSNDIVSSLSIKLQSYSLIFIVIMMILVADNEYYYDYYCCILIFSLVPEHFNINRYYFHELYPDHGNIVSSWYTGNSDDNDSLCLFDVDMENHSCW